MDLSVLQGGDIGSTFSSNEGGGGNSLGNDTG